MERNQILYFKPTILSLDNHNTITNPYDIANTFNNYLVAIAETTKKSIKYPQTYFLDYLSNESSSIYIISTTYWSRRNRNPIHKKRAIKFKESLNSMAQRIYILFLLKNEISTQLADLFNLSFITGVFPCYQNCKSCSCF